MRSGLAQARQVANILKRQRSYPDEIERLASGLRQLLTPDEIKELRTELGRQRRTVLARSAQHSDSRVFIDSSVCRGSQGLPTNCVYKVMDAG